MRPLFFAAVLVVAGCSSTGGDTHTASGAKASATPKFTDIVLTDNESTKAPKDVFGADTAKLFLIFNFENIPNGTVIQGSWICEDAPDLDIPKDFKIDEASITVGPLTNSGNFSISKPNSGWPAGDYRVDVQMDGKIVETRKFKIGK